MSDAVKHSGWMPGSPSMDQGGALAPDFDKSGSDVTGHSGDKPDGSSSSMSDSGGTISSHIMEGDYDSLFPGGSQGNLEPLKGSGVKGA